MSCWLGWHFLPKDGKLRYGDGRSPEDGVALSADGPLVLCERGMHASADLLDCLQHAPGPILCRVELRGERIDGNDKSVARERVILWRIEATRVLRRFAYWCADQAVRVHATASLHAAGDKKNADILASLPEIVDEETRAAASAAARIAAANDAASATNSAVWSVEWSANAADAGARSAASAAARAAKATASAAAWTTAWAAARASAWDVAWTAAWAAAWDTAMAAARDAQRSKLLALVEEEIGMGIAEKDSAK